MASKTKINIKNEKAVLRTLSINIMILLFWGFFGVFRAKILPSKVIQNISPFFFQVISFKA
jgi:hypothetical protein